MTERRGNERAEEEKSNREDMGNESRRGQGKYVANTERRIVT